MTCRAARAWNRCSPCRTPRATLVGTDATTNRASRSADTRSTSRNTLSSGAKARPRGRTPCERHRRLQRAPPERAHVALAARRAQRGRLVRDRGLDDAERHREHQDDREQSRERSVVGRAEHPADDDVEQVVRAVDAGEDHQQQRRLPPERMQPCKGAGSGLPARERLILKMSGPYLSAALLESARGGGPVASSHDGDERSTRPVGESTGGWVLAVALSRDLARVPPLVRE